MENHSFTTSILVDQTPKEAFDAINNVRGWWDGEVEGHTHNLNDEFTYRHKEFHYSKQKLIEVIQGKKVVWLVTESSLNFVKEKSEWTGTKIIFEISKQDDKSGSGRTQIRFTHLGLVPEYQCFDACSNAWSEIINNSLRSLITTGKGQTKKDKKQVAKNR